MKIETKKVKSNFKPFELKITFETAEELDSFKAMCQVYPSVGECVDKNKLFINSIFNKQVLEKMLDNMFDKLEWSEDLKKHNN